jgi:hypothetical protein
MSNNLGLYIPNSDYIFKAKRVKAILDYIFLITKQDEIIVFERKDETYGTSALKKKFILFTHPQKRQPLVDIFIAQVMPSLMVIFFIKSLGLQFQNDYNINRKFRGKFLEYQGWLMC